MYVLSCCVPAFDFNSVQMAASLMGGPTQMCACGSQQRAMAARSECKACLHVSSLILNAIVFALGLCTWTRVRNSAPLSCCSAPCHFSLLLGWGDGTKQVRIVCLCMSVPMNSSHALLVQRTSQDICVDVTVFVLFSFYFLCNSKNSFRQAPQAVFCLHYRP